MKKGWRSSWSASRPSSSSSSPASNSPCGHTPVTWRAAAAEQGSQVASDYGSTPDAGVQAAYRFIASTGPGTLTHPQVVNRTLPGDVAQVTVTGRAQTLIPWFTLDVSATSDAPVQKYRASG